MAKSMKENGKTANHMVKASRPGLTGVNTTDYGGWANLSVLERRYTLMEGSKKVIGTRESLLKEVTTLFLTYVAPPKDF